MKYMIKSVVYVLTGMVLGIAAIVALEGCSSKRSKPATPVSVPNSWKLNEGLKWYSNKYVLRRKGINARAAVTEVKEDWIVIESMGRTLSVVPKHSLFRAMVRKPTGVVSDYNPREATACDNTPPGYSCSPDFVHYLQAVPNDEWYEGYLWGLKQGGASINAQAGWDIRTDATSNTVVVIDTGLDHNHPDLIGNVDMSNAFNGLNGQQGQAPDDHGHGTHVAGTIGAVGNNQIGITGVAYRADLVPCKIFDGSGSTTTGAIVACIDHAADLRLRGKNVRLTNNSWGGGGFSQPIYDAIERNRDLGILFVAAAGNYSTDNDSEPFYPANYNLENIISVGAIDSGGIPGSFSNWGRNTVDIFAPGVQILSTYPGINGCDNQTNPCYVSWDGTSMATPHVAGALALYFAEFPTATATEAFQSLMSTVDKKSSLLDRCVSQGVLKLDGLLASGPSPVPTSTPEPTPTAVPTIEPTQTPVPVPTVTPTPFATATPGGFFKCKDCSWLPNP